MTKKTNVPHSQPVKELPPFGARDKLSYALGDFGCNMSFALNAYLMLFYTQYIGLSMQIWGIIILALKIWDGINDPIMGGLMDSLRPGKRGKFKTYIFYGSFVLAVAGAMCFLPIPSAPLGIKILVCVLGYLAWDMTYTVVNVPYGAMNAAITANPSERAQLSTWRNFGGILAALIIAILIPMVCFDRDNNLLGGHMFGLALVLGLIGLITLQLMVRGVTERVHSAATAERPVEKYNYFQALKGFFTNRAAVGITLAAMFSLLMSNNSASTILFQVYFKNAQISGIIGLIVTLPLFLLMPLVKPVVDRFGKREAAAFPLLLGIASSILMIILPIKPETGLPIWVVLSILTSVSVTVFTMVGWAMVADCIDYQELRTGRREEGTVYATYSLGRKLAQGFGASIIAFLLLLTGYEAAQGAEQAAGVGDNIRILLGTMQLVFLVGIFLLLRFLYPLDKKTVDEMGQKLGHGNCELIRKDEDE